MNTRRQILVVGILLAATSSAFATVRYVNCNSTNPTPPYTNWGTAAVNILDAVGEALAGDEVVVTNGTYIPVWVDKALTLRSVNGPDLTVIDGGGLEQCAHMASGASLVGFTLTNGAAAGFSYEELFGGGVYCESTYALVTNCVITGNLAYYGGGGAYSGTLNNCILRANSTSGYDEMFGIGGGACDSTLNNCTLVGNSAWNMGGGACFGTLNNCTLVGNSARAGGGASGEMGPCRLNNCTLVGNSAGDGGGANEATLNNCTLTGNWATNSGGGASVSKFNNCIVYFNTAPNSANYWPDWAEFWNYSCTTPLPTNGVGNITNAPLFVDYANGNLRLQSNSPCINAGNNSCLTNDYLTNILDLDGNPRMVSGTVDIGAYEFQGTGSRISYAWLQQFSLPTDGSADFTDPDGDGLNNWQEWRCGTCPTNPLSALSLLPLSVTGTNVTVSWQSAAGVNYFLERSTNLTVTPSFTPVYDGIPGQSGTTTCTDTTAAGRGPFFYRVGVGQ